MEKRDGERLPILGELLGEVTVYQPMHVKEVSRGGVALETQFPLQLNSLHHLRLTLGGTSVVVQGRVAHSRVSEIDQDLITYRSGIEFVELNERAATVIAEFLDTLKASRRGV
jgi:hypothetical protein